MRNKNLDGVYELKKCNFDLSDFFNLNLPRGLTLKVTEDDLERFLENTNNHGGFSVLALLNPQFRFNEVLFHLDHIHPYSRFQNAIFDDYQLDDDQRKEWLARRDKIANLQLLEGRRNQSKNDTPLGEWLNKHSETEVTDFKRMHHFPVNTSIDFSNFIKFYDERRKIIRMKLADMLGVHIASESHP